MSFPTAVEAELDRRREAAKPEETATYTYTSGTTGPPKAVIQTHTNHLSMASMVHSSGIITDGMVPKVRAALATIAQGVQQTQIVNLAGLLNNSGTIFTS